MARFAIRFACLTTTPFGDDVEPEVYCRNAVSDGFASGRVLRRPAAQCTQSSIVSSGSDLETLRRALARGLHKSSRLVRASRGPQSATILAVSSLALARRGTIR